MISWWNDTISRKRPGTKTERGSVIPDWSTASELVIGGCHVQPASTSLTQDGRIEGLFEGMTLYAPSTADIKAGDHIICKGNEYAINGEVKDWPSPTGQLAHLVINLVRWSG